MSRQKEVKQLCRKVKKQGWEVIEGKHIRLVHPSGDFTTISKSPTCRRWLKNAQEDIRKIEEKNL